MAVSVPPHSTQVGAKIKKPNLRGVHGRACPHAHRVCKTEPLRRPVPRRAPGPERRQNHVPIAGRRGVLVTANTLGGPGHIGIKIRLDLRQCNLVVAAIFSNVRAAVQSIEKVLGENSVLRIVVPDCDLTGGSGGQNRKTFTRAGVRRGNPHPRRVGKTAPQDCPEKHASRYTATERASSFARFAYNKSSANPLISGTSGSASTGNR